MDRDNAANTEVPLAERAYRALRQAIVRGEFEPGARLRRGTRRALPLLDRALPALPPGASTTNTSNCWLLYWRGM